MKANPSAQPVKILGTWTLKSLFALLLLSIVGVATWQLGQVNPPPPYRASLLNVHLTGAVLGNFSFSAADLTANWADPAEFFFVTEEEAPLAFWLEFKGAPEATQKATYDLSADYPLTLTLLEDGEVGATFTATEGTAEFHESGGRVAAFMMDESGRTLSLSAQFPYSEKSTCSETYWFCFNADEGGVARVN